jgi:hypothetical protein
MKKYSYLIIIVLMSSLVLAGCSLLSNISQVPATEQSGITYLTKTVPPIPLANLVGLWYFSGNVDDSSGGGNDGDVDGVTTYVDSPMGQAFSFNGSTCVCVSDSDSLDITQATIEAWVKPSVSTQTGCARIVFKGTNYPFKPLYFLAYDGSGTRMRMVVFIGGCGGLRKTAISATALTDTEKWYHIVGTYDGEKVKIYIDGFLEGTSSVSTEEDIDIGTQALGIGRNPEANSYGYKGLIDEVRIWNVALSEDQLGSIYHFGGILPPIKKDGNSDFKLGRTIPVKFQLWDDQGNLVTDAVANIFVKKTSNYTSGEEIDAIYTTAATNGNLFRYDSESEQYIFNLSTKLPLNNGVSWSAGKWEIRIELDDGMSYYVQIGLRP